MMRKFSRKTRVLVAGLLAVSLSFGTPSVSVADTASTVVEDGVYVITSVLDDGKALDVKGESKKDGANVQLWDRNDGNGQRFRVTNLGGNQYSIVNEYSGKALDIKGNSKKKGANVHQWEWTGSDNQRFAIEPVKDGGYVIKAVSSGLFLDVKGSRIANGTNVIQWTDNGGNANQRWNLNPYDFSVLYSADARARELEEGLTLLDEIPESVLLAGDVALGKWLKENGKTVQSRASFWGCTAALASLIGGNLVGVAKLLKIKRYMNALGGVRKAVYLMWKSSFSWEKMKAAGGALGSLAAEIAGVSAVRKQCFR